MPIDPAMLAAGGSLLQGIGSLGGLFGRESKGPSLADQYELARQNAYYMPRYQAEGARAAGLHPLFAMGLTPQFAPTVTVGSGQKDGIASAVGGIGRAMGHFADAKMARELHEANLDQIDASTLEKVSAAVLNLKNAQANAVPLAAAGSLISRAEEEYRRRPGKVEEVKFDSLPGKYRREPGHAQAMEDTTGDLPSELNNLLWLFGSWAENLIRGPAKDFFDAKRMNEHIVYCRKYPGRCGSIDRSK